MGDLRRVARDSSVTSLAHPLKLKFMLTAVEGYLRRYYQ